MKKAKEGATRRLRIASFLCLLFMIFEFVGKKCLFVLLILFCFDRAQQKNVITHANPSYQFTTNIIYHNGHNSHKYPFFSFFFFVVACNEEYITVYMFTPQQLKNGLPYGGYFK